MILTLANAEINKLILTLNILTAFIRLGRAGPVGAGCPSYYDFDFNLAAWCPPYYYLTYFLTLLFGLRRDKQVDFKLNDYIYNNT